MKRFLLCFALLAACGGRTAYQRYPGAPATLDRASSDAKALEIADKVFAAAGGPGNWDNAKQLRWRQTITADGKQTLDVEEIWDRWNARHLGRMFRTDGTHMVVGYELYGSFSMGYVQQPGEKEVKRNLDDAGRAAALKVAKEVFNEHTSVLTMQFLLLEPGAKLAYVGTAKDDAGNENYDELKVTFGDPLRADLEFHPVVDRATNMIVRLEILKTGTQRKVGYTLKDWVTIGGLKFATNRSNMGYSGETIVIKDIKVGGVDDNEFIAPITH
ncbi:MAG: hypothetical protein H0V17_13800 [Deltaproteobacteria bacterium]|nr:hypothetical protein [Deltaproteobacteria bacterium]